MDKKSYQETVDWLFSRLPMFQNVGKKALKKDLTNIIAFCDYLKNPQNQFKSIHVAGTNGKGSTCHMLASVLQEAKLKVGLLTSPHLKDFRERIRINGKKCSKEFVIDFVEHHKQRIESQNASFFEIATAMAFEYFAQQKVDIAVVETGLGGALDSTNIVNPILSMITNIGFDHMNMLGDTLPEIAKSKAGIIKPNTPVLIGEKLKETEPVFREKAKQKKAAIYFVEDFQFSNYDSDLKGSYQKKNIQLAVLATKLLQNEFSISDSDLEIGLLKVRSNTGLRGRWEVLQQEPKIVADTGHNKEAIEFLVKQIESEKYKNLHLVLGFVKGKEVEKIVSLFPKDANYYLTQPNIARKLPVKELKNIIPKELKSSYYESVELAIKAAKEKAKTKDFIFIGGSTFVVAEIL